MISKTPAKALIMPDLAFLIQPIKVNNSDELD